MHLPFFGGFIPLIIIGYFAIVVYLILLASRLVKAVERIADKITGTN